MFFSPVLLGRRTRAGLMPVSAHPSPPSLALTPPPAYGGHGGLVTAGGGAAGPASTCGSERDGDRHRGRCKAGEGPGSQAEYVGSWASLVLTIGKQFD